jgi:hypothetical protein
MKKIQLRHVKAALLSLTGVALLTVAAHAQTTISTGDLILGVEDQNGKVSNDYEVDIGNISTFLSYDRSNAAGTVINVANLNADLTATFNESTYETPGTYSTNPALNQVDIAFGIFGTSGNNTALNQTGYANNTLFLSNPEATPGTIGSNLSPDTGSSNGAPYLESQIASAETGPAFSGFSGEPETGSGLDATSVSAAGSNSFSSREGGSAFETGFNDLNDFSGNLSGSNVAGPTGAVSDLDVILPTNNSTATAIGAFEFTSGGELEFITVAAAPEPSTYALMFVGAALLAWQLRRRSFNS